MSEEAAQALRDFFRERREQKKLQKQAQTVQSPLDGAQ
jgi:tRNA(adenine34) deaminase